MMQVSNQLKFLPQIFYTSFVKLLCTLLTVVTKGATLGTLVFELTLVTETAPARRVERFASVIMGNTIPTRRTLRCGFRFRFLYTSS